MAQEPEDPKPKYEPIRHRCTSCGNLTRFDVTTTRRTRAYHHYTVGGELTIEEETLLDEVLESVECRWCGPTGVLETMLSPVGTGEQQDETSN